MKINLNINNLNTINYCFLDNNNKVIDVAAFARDISEEDLLQSMSLFKAVKYVNAENKNFAGIGSTWNEQYQKFEPQNTFINMHWDFELEKLVPSIPKPEEIDISEGEYLWDYSLGEWYFIAPIPEIPEGEENKWLWDRENKVWNWQE